MNQSGIIVSQKRSLGLLGRLMPIKISALFCSIREIRFYGIEIVIYLFANRGLGIGGV